MPDPLEQVLRLVAEGRLTAEEAAPILDALDASGSTGRRPDRPVDDRADEAVGGAAPSAIRIEVTDGGRKIVNLRVPITLGRTALDRIPGLSVSTADLVREALTQNRTGTLLDVDDEGDGVRISLE